MMTPRKAAPKKLIALWAPRDVIDRAAARVTDDVIKPKK